MNDETPSPFEAVGDQPVEARIVAWVLGESSAFEAAELERLCDERPELLVFRRRMRALHGLLTDTEASEEDHSWKLPPEKRTLLDEIFGEEKVMRFEVEKERHIRRSGRRAILAIAACVVLTITVAGLMHPMNLLFPKKSAEAVIEIRPRTNGLSIGFGNSSQAKGDATMTPQFFGTEFEKIKSANSLGKVVENLDLTDRWGVDKQTAIRRLKGSVETTNIRGTDLIKIRVNESNESDAREIASEVASSYREYRAELEQKDSVAELSELNKAVREQEDKVEERRKVLATIVRTKGIIYKGQDSSYGQSGVDEDQGASDANGREEAIRRGLDAQDYVDAKRDFETDQELLQTMRLEQINKSIKAKMPDDQIVVHEDPMPSRKMKLAGSKSPNVKQSIPVIPTREVAVVETAPTPAAAPQPPVSQVLPEPKVNRADGDKSGFQMSLAKSKSGMEEAQQNFRRSKLAIESKPDALEYKGGSTLPEIAESSKLAPVSALPSQALADNFDTRNAGVALDALSLSTSTEEKNELSGANSYALSRSRQIVDGKLGIGNETGLQHGSANSKGVHPEVAKSLGSKNSPNDHIYYRNLAEAGSTDSDADSTLALKGKTSGDAMDELQTAIANSNQSAQEGEKIWGGGFVDGKPLDGDASGKKSVITGSGRINPELTKGPGTGNNLDSEIDFYAEVGKDFGLSNIFNEEPSSSGYPWGSKGKSKSDSLSIFNGTTVDGIPGGQRQFASSGITNGLRSGDQAVSRNSIDAILNNPNRVAGDFVDADKSGMPTLAPKEGTDSDMPNSGVRAARPRISPRTPTESTVELSETPSPQEFEGFVNYGSPIQQTSVPPDEKSASSPLGRVGGRLAETPLTEIPQADGWKNQEEFDSKTEALKNLEGTYTYSGLTDISAGTLTLGGGETGKDMKGLKDSDSLEGEKSLGNLAQREMIRRQNAVPEGDALLLEGRDAYAKGDYQKVSEKYRYALDKLPESPLVEERRKAYSAHLADASVAQAMQDRKVGKYAEARTLLDEALAADPGNESAKREKDYLDDPIRTNPALTYEHTPSVDKVRRGLYMAEGSLNLGKYDDAQKDYEEVLRTDPYNSAARRGMEKIANAKSDYYRAAYDHTRAELLAQVDGVTELSVPEDKKATVDVIREFKYPDEFEPPELPEKNADKVPLLGDIPALGRLFPTTPATPTAWYVQDKAEKAKLNLAELMEEIPASENPYSTFSLNINDASFQLAKAALAKGEQPDPESIKPEQFYNAVDYGDPAPSAAQPVAATIEQSAHPVIPGRELVRVALRTASIGRSAAQPLSLTLLVDQSGSMVREDRRVAMENALKQLGGLLTQSDRITVIGFSRTSHLLADGLAGDQGAKLGDIINQAASEGGTNLEEAMKLGAQLAERHQLAGAQNRIVLFTDGAANLGNADPEKLAKQVADLRQKGIAFDIAGIGADGLNDRLLSELARHGNGRYYLVSDSKNENFARQLAGAFRPAAENVKVQVNFNPQRVGKYKLIGFEKDRLKTEDFRNDSVDAAELAADEAGVAIYQVEVLPEGTGEIGEVSVRFRDTASSEMVERTWTIPHESSGVAFDRAAPSMQLAGLSMLAAEKLKGGPLADAIDFKQFATPLADVKQFYAASPRVGEMLQVIEKLK